VLGESIKDHIKEEGTMFPEEKADLDWEALEQKARKQKETLKANNGESGDSTNRAARERCQSQPRGV
jgi:hypothetical protein